MICILLTSLAIAGLLVLNMLYKRTNHYNNQFLDVKKIQTSVRNGEKYQIVNLGSNHPKFAFDYSVTPEIKGANWAIGPQTFEYDFAVLRKYRPYLAQNAVVLLPICLKNFFLYRQENRATHAKYYTFLPREDIVGYSGFEKIKFMEFPLIFNMRLLKRLIRDVKRDCRLELSANPMTTERQLKKDADGWIQCWDREFGVSSTSFELTDKNKDDIAANVHILQSMISYCLEEGLKPVLVLIPVSTYLAEKFPGDYLQEHLFRYINEANVAGVPFFNYLNDPRLTDSHLYINSFFFNKEGRKLFTRIFIGDLKQKGIL